jgi:hypothetical protein
MQCRGPGGASRTDHGPPTLSTCTAKCPPSQGLHKFKTQDGKICFISTISPHYYCTISMVLLSREKGGVALRAVTTSQGRSHFDFIRMSEANLSHVFALDVPARRWANKLHSTECSSSSTTEKRR